MRSSTAGNRRRRIGTRSSHAADPKRARSPVVGASPPRLCCVAPALSHDRIVVGRRLMTTYPFGLDRTWTPGTRRVSIRARSPAHPSSPPTPPADAHPSFAVVSRLVTSQRLRQTRILPRPGESPARPHPPCGPPRPTRPTGPRRTRRPLARISLVLSTRSWYSCGRRALMAAYSLDLRTRVLKDSDAGMASKLMAEKYAVSRASGSQVGAVCCHAARASATSGRACSVAWSTA